MFPSCAGELPSPTSLKMTKSLLKTLSSKATSEAPDLWVAITIIFSATTYFFDYGSNIATAWKYYILEYTNVSTEVSIRAEGPRSEFPGIFPGIISIIVVAHVINAVVFYLHLNKSKEALYSAYLLPVIYLRKLSLLVWRTGHLQGVRDLRSSEIDAIYNILAAALETGPQLILQFHVFSELGYLSHTGAKVPTVLVLSLAASFISGAYNSGLAMITTMEKATLVGRASMGITGGLHIVSALLVRSLAFEVITEEGFYHSSSSFRYYWFYLIIAVTVPFGAFWILLRRSNDSVDAEERSWKVILKCISYAYVSITLGPLYPLTSHSKKVKEPSSRGARIQIFNACMLHVSLDALVVLFVCGAHGRTWLTPCYVQWSRERDRRIHKRIFRQRFVSCSWFVALIVFSFSLYLVTLLSFLVLDSFTDNRLEKKSSFSAEEDRIDSCA